jgi:hypothetical protein
LPASKRLVETTAKTPPTDRYNPCRLRIVLRNGLRMGAPADSVVPVVDRAVEVGRRLKQSASSLAE